MNTASCPPEAPNPGQSQADVLIVDMKVSNLRSVANAFERIGAKTTVSGDPATVAEAKALVLPGVGAFEEAMSNLNDQGLVEVLRQRAGQDRVPLIGICLGMQLLADASEEHGEHEGLGLIGGRVTRLQANDPSYRVPNIGWCDTHPDKASILFPETDDVRSFYYVHSYHLNCADASDAAAHIEFSGQDVTVAVERDNIFGAQFHPEKSQDTGLDMLERFVSHVQNTQ